MNCRVLFAALLAALAWVSAVPPGLAADAAQAEPDVVVVAIVNGTKIYRSDVKETIAGLPERYGKMPPLARFQLIVNSLIDSKLVAAEARREGLHETAAVKRRVARIEEQILERSLLVRRITEGTSEDTLQERYRALVEKTDGEKELHARHILVKTVIEANEVIAEIKKGGDFAALAKRSSIGPSAPNGGDLGYFGRGDMLAQFSEAAFALVDGEITKKPVRTLYGWHVIKAIARRDVVPPSFAATADKLREKLSREIGVGVMKDLRAQAVVERFNPDGSPLEADAKSD